MNITLTLKQIAIHEACHAIVGKVLEDYCNIVAVSANPNYNGFINKSEREIGGLHLQLSENLYSKQAVCIIAWAGFIGQNIAQFGLQEVWQKRSNILSDANILNTWGISRDIEIFQEMVPQLASTRKCSIMDYQMFCLLININFLCDNMIWAFVDKLSVFLLEKNDLTLSNEELQSHFENLGFHKYLSISRSQLLFDWGFNTPAPSFRDSFA